MRNSIATIVCIAAAFAVMMGQGAKVAKKTDSQPANIIRDNDGFGMRVNNQLASGDAGLKVAMDMNMFESNV